jgi:hypothetical protein
LSRENRDVDLGLATARAESEGGAASLASLAESQRRAGALEYALRLANDALAHDASDVAARATAALAALELGRDAEARSLLEALVAPVAPVAEPLGVDAIEDGELDDAFAEAEPEAAAMRDANDLAFDAMRAASLDAPEGIAVAAVDSPFQTRTMAALLERQGDAAAAHSIRSAIASRERADVRESMQAGGRRRADRIRVLERWLVRTRRGTA